MAEAAEAEAAVGEEAGQRHQEEAGQRRHHHHRSRQEDRKKQAKSVLKKFVFSCHSPPWTDAIRTDCVVRERTHYNAMTLPAGIRFNVIRRKHIGTARFNESPGESTGILNAELV